MIYIFFTKNGKEEITEKPLKDEGIEWFYRLIDSSMSVVKSLTVNYSPVFIAGKKCYKGIAISKVGEYIPFYYTCEPLKVCSPLNAFLPLHFPKDVLSIKFPVDWTTKDVKKLLAQ